MCDPYVTHVWLICDWYVTHMWPICDLLGLMVKPCSAPWRDYLWMNVGGKTPQRCSYWSGNRWRGTAWHAWGNFMKKKVVCDSSFFLSKNHTNLRMTMFLVFWENAFFVVSSTISRGNCTVMRDLLFFLHHVPCHLALSRPVLVFCVLWVTFDILQMYTRWGYVVYYWNHPLTLHTFSNALQFKTFSVNSRSCKRKPIS